MPVEVLGGTDCDIAHLKYVVFIMAFKLVDIWPASRFWQK